MRPRQLMGSQWHPILVLKLNTRSKLGSWTWAVVCGQPTGSQGVIAVNGSQCPSSKLMVVKQFFGGYAKQQKQRAIWLTMACCQGEGF
mmetsp:Transcript_25286/g.43221  ORF Transcript_25286/g.43221 Transcript_25286/m.43221 type:complete len:88 (-) Transcript_25286:122-385(-)